MTSIDTLKKITELVIEAQEAYNHAARDHERITAIKLREAQYHRDILSEKVKMTTILSQLQKQQQDFLKTVQLQGSTQRQQKQLNVNDPWIREMTPRTHSGSVAMKNYAENGVELI